MKNVIERTARIVYACIAFVLAYASAIVAGGKIALAASLAAAGLQAQGCALGVGPTPASMLSASMPQAALTIYYNSQFTENLKSRTPGMRITSRRSMPTQAGQQYRDFMYAALPQNTVQHPEGDVGTGITLSIPYTTFSLGQWADFVNFSDFVLSTTIDPALENVERELAYRCGGTIQRLVLAQFDAARTTDASVAGGDATSGTQAMTKDTITRNVGSLRGRNVQPLDGMTRFGVLIHPFFTSDILQDNTNNSLVDVLKHTLEGQMKLQELPSPGNGDNATVLSWGGATFFETTLLTTNVPTWSGGATAIRTYMAGKDAVISVKLSRDDRTDISDGDYRNLKLWRGKYALGQSFDPAGLIGGGTSYNIVGTWGLPPDTVMRCRCFDFVPQTT